MFFLLMINKDAVLIQIFMKQMENLLEVKKLKIFIIAIKDYS